MFRRIVFRRIVVTAMLAGATLAVGAAPAQAFPTGGDSLVVLSYYQGSQLVGQRWHGCGQPAGGWGDDEGRIVASFPSCS